MGKTFGVSDGFGSGGAGIVPGAPFMGEDGVEEDLAGLLRGGRNRIAGSVASVAAMKAIAAADRGAGMIVVKTDDGSLWRFHATSTVTGDDVVVVTPTAGSGRWLRMPGSCVLSFAYTFATADAAVLWTVPTGCLFSIEEPYWTVSTTHAGGSSSAIGVSSNKTSFTTKGDLLGGSGGDVAGTLTAPSPVTTPIMGTVGAGFDTLAKRRVIWFPGNTIRFDRITSVFTSGVGAVNLKGALLRNAGA